MVCTKIIQRRKVWGLIEWGLFVTDYADMAGVSLVQGGDGHTISLFDHFTASLK